MISRPRPQPYRLLCPEAETSAYERLLNKLISLHGDQPGCHKVANAVKRKFEGKFIFQKSDIAHPTSKIPQGKTLLLFSTEALDDSRPLSGQKAWEEQIYYHYLKEVDDNDDTYGAIFDGEDNNPDESEPDESDVEDALHWVESNPFQGSDKQKKWASDIALQNLEEIALAWKSGKEIPLSAKWWIENRDNINI